MHPATATLETLDVLRTRAEPLGIEVVVADERELTDVSIFFGALLQYPASNGDVFDYRTLVERFHGQRTGGRCRRSAGPDPADASGRVRC